MKQHIAAAAPVDRRVFDARHRLRSALPAGQQRKAGFPQAPDQLGFGGRFSDFLAQTQLLLGGQAIIHVRDEFDEQESLARSPIELEQIASGLKLALAFRWSRSTRSICSIAAGFRSSNSTVACIASLIESKNINASPLRLGRDTILNSADVMAAKVPSLPQIKSLRLLGSRTHRSSA